jgi:hypothetical protein
MAKNIGNKDNPASPITGLAGTQSMDEKSGFVTSGYLDKKGTQYGEAAKFNFLPPGMEIDNQQTAEINAMPYKKVIEESYPGDGWEPKPSTSVA